MRFRRGMTTAAIAVMVSTGGSVALAQPASAQVGRTPVQVIMDESGGRVNAINSESGAAGVCQVLPSTSKYVGGPSTSEGIVGLGLLGQLALCEKVRLRTIADGNPNPWAESGGSVVGSFTAPGIAASVNTS